MFLATTSLDTRPIVQKNLINSLLPTKNNFLSMSRGFKLYNYLVFNHQSRAKELVLRIRKQGLFTINMGGIYSLLFYSSTRFLNKYLQMAESMMSRQCHSQLEHYQVFSYAIVLTY